MFDGEVSEYVIALLNLYNGKSSNEILNLDPINFWKDNHNKYKHLFRIASRLTTDVLPAPAQSAASERGFSQMTNIIDSGRVSLDGYTGSILSQLKIRFNSELLYGKRNETTRKHLTNNNVGIQYPPFGRIPDNKELFINFELLEEIVDPEYEVESVVYSDDDDE